MKKKLNTSSVISELAQESVFFGKTNQTAENDKENNRTENRSEIRTDMRTEERPENRTYELPFKRSTKRYSFEFFDDQIDRIKKIKLNAEMAGKRISMSEIVRQAMDLYFDKQSTESFGIPNERDTERS